MVVSATPAAGVMPAGLASQRIEIVHKDAAVFVDVLHNVAGRVVLALSRGTVLEDHRRLAVERVEFPARDVVAIVDELRLPAVAVQDERGDDGARCRAGASGWRRGGFWPWPAWRRCCWN